jgi:hypothetical protein
VSRASAGRHDYTSAPVSARRLSILVCAFALALGVAACGQVSDPPSLENNGVYVDAGPITYQLEISRQLNPYATEDKQYLVGLPSGNTPTGITPDQLWYGVFMWAKNQTHKTQSTSDSFDIVDTEGNRYYPLKLDSATNPYAWTAQSLQPSGIEPGPGTTASFGPTQGGLLLFKLNISAYANRPLTLQIYAAGQKQPSTISLDF